MTDEESMRTRAEVEVARRELVALQKGLEAAARPAASADGAAGGAAPPPPASGQGKREDPAPPPPPPDRPVPEFRAWTDLHAAVKDRRWALARVVVAVTEATSAGHHHCTEPFS